MPVETIVVPRTSDLGDGFVVRRSLPSAARRMVGPFVFFDEMGPVQLDAGRGLDVRPHPHIGLATVTYLFDGEIVHRDSLGTVQTIRPGELNWMTAGRGIVHSERTPASLRQRGSSLGGLQLWVALPRRHEDAPPTFAHHAAGALPAFDLDGAHVRVVAGAAFGARAPVELLSPLFYVDATLGAGAVLPVPAEHAERAAYVVGGEVVVDGVAQAGGRLLVFAAGPAAVKAGAGGARLVLIGGDPLDGPRHVWWNFVASSRERIEQAKADWAAGRFAKVPGDDEFIPLPGSSAAAVRYP